MAPPERDHQKDCTSVLPDSSDNLREQRDWGKGIQEKAGPLMDQSIPVL